MGSRIDPSRPADGAAAAKSDLRLNLAAARDEINHGGFFASLGGGAERTVQDRLRDLVSVKDFGARGDDATDDAAAVQAAVDAGAGVVLVPPGVYRLGAPLALGNVLLLAKRATFAPTAAFPSRGDAGAALLRVTGNRTVVVGCSLRGEGPGGGRHAGHGVWLDPTVNRVQLQDIYIAGVRGDGVHGDGDNWMSRFENVRCDTVDVGFRFTNIGNTTLTFQNCYCADTRVGFDFRQVFGFALLGSAVDKSREHALVFDTSVGAVVGGYFESCRQALRLAGGDTRVTITDSVYNRLGAATAPGPTALFEPQDGRLTVERTRFVHLDDHHYRYFLAVPDWGGVATFRDNTIRVLAQRNDIRRPGGVIEIIDGESARSDGVRITFA